MGRWSLVLMKPFFYTHVNQFFIFKIALLLNRKILLYKLCETPIYLKVRQTVILLEIWDNSNKHSKTNREYWQNKHSKRNITTLENLSRALYWLFLISHLISHFFLDMIYNRDDLAEYRTGHYNSCLATFCYILKRGQNLTNLNSVCFPSNLYSIFTQKCMLHYKNTDSSKSVSNLVLMFILWIFTGFRFLYRSGSGKIQGVIHHIQYLAKFVILK